MQTSTARKPNARRPRIIFQPRTHLAFQAGVNMIVDAISPTLGPTPRYIAVEQVLGRSKPAELLDDGAAIARHIVQIPNRSQDVGAMFVRNMLWKLHEDCGDGTTTAAVIFQSLFNEGVRFIATGSNPMLLRRHLEAISSQLLEHIDNHTIRPSGRTHLASVAETLSHDPALAKILGEIFDIIGDYGRLEIRSGSAKHLERYYSEGIYWDGGLVSRALLDNLTTLSTNYDNAGILVTDLEILEPQELVGVLNQALNAGFDRLVIVAKKITDRALALLLMKENRKKIRALVVKIPGYDDGTRNEFLEDLALLTNAKTLLAASGSSLAGVTTTHFGRTRRAWANLEFFGIVGGGGDVRRIRRQIASLRDRISTVKNLNRRSQLQVRLSKLMSGTATLYVGDTSDQDMIMRKALAKRTAAAMRGAIRDGVVPGGGAMLLSCRDLLRERMRLAQTDDERVACKILLTSVEAPVRTLLANSGFEPLEFFPEINKAGNSYSFDVIQGKIGNMAACGIFDSSSVTKKSLSAAIRSAALALTVEVIVHRKLPPNAAATT